MNESTEMMNGKADQNNMGVIPGLMDVKAGRELDQMIDELVFGHLDPESHGVFFREEDHAQAPQYSTDITAALTIMTQLKDRFHTALSVTSEGKFQCTMKILNSRYDSEVGSESDSAAEAICLCAIEAVAL